MAHLWRLPFAGYHCLYCQQLPHRRILRQNPRQTSHEYTVMQVYGLLQLRPQRLKGALVHPLWPARRASVKGTVVPAQLGIEAALAAVVPVGGVASFRKIRHAIGAAAQRQGWRLGVCIAWCNHGRCGGIQTTTGSSQGCKRCGASTRGNPGGRRSRCNAGAVQVDQIGLIANGAAFLPGRVIGEYRWPAYRIEQPCG